MARIFVAERGDVVFVSDTMAVGGAKSTLDPLSLDGGLEMHDALDECFLLGGGGVGAYAAAAAAVVLSSS